MRPLVLHVIPHLWSGAGGVLTRLCEAQRRQGPVAIVTAGAGGVHPDWPSYRARLHRAGVRHHTIDFFDRTAGQFWSGVTQLADLVRELQPAVIHAHAGVPACAAAITRSMTGRRPRLIGQMYSWGPDRPEWMNQQDMWGFGQADRIVCSARAYWDLLVRYGVPSRRLVYLPWGLPLERLPYRHPVSSPRSGHRDGPFIGFVGRIEPRKGQLDLVRAVARVRRACPGVRLQLVGPVADEAYAARVREEVAAQGLTDVVVLSGEVREISTHLRQWDMFVSLSSDEGQGLAVLEAMAMGVPVVARAVAGISDFLADGRTGVAIPGATSAAAAKSIRATWTNPSQTRSIIRQARRLVERRYDWTSTVAAFERLYWNPDWRGPRLHPPATVVGSVSDQRSR